MDFDDDLIACAQIVERADPDRFATVMAAKPAARVVLFPIYAFNVEVSRAPWVTSEPMIAEMRLQWWYDALDEVIAGGAVRRHEVVTPLALAVDADVARLLQQVVEARRKDTEPLPFDDGAQFESYIEATGGALMEAASRALGDTDGRAARDLGFASGLAAYLLAVPELEARGKAPLADGTEAAVAGHARQGLERLKAARAARGQVPGTARPALWPGWMAAPVLTAAAKAPGRVKDGTLRPSEARQRGRRLWVASTGRW